MILKSPIRHRQKCGSSNGWVKSHSAGLGSRPFDTCRLVARGPVVDGHLATAQEVGDLRGRSLLTLEQDHPATNNRTMKLQRVVGCSAVEGALRCQHFLDIPPRFVVL